MQKIKAKALTAMLLTAIVIAVLPLTVNASTGYIRINTTTPPSTPGQQVPAGGNVNLYVGGVTFSGGQFYLIISGNGFSDTTGWTYSTVFNLANVTDPDVDTYTNANGTWQVGYNWVNGSIPLNIAGGNYFIKIFDGSATSVAVTDTYITVTATFQVAPTSGPGGAALALNGYAFGASALVNLTYYNTTSPFNKITIANLVPANSLGQFTYPLAAPDLRQLVTPADDQTPTWTTITFNAKDSSGEYNATYDEYARGLKQVHTAIATGLWGNATVSGVARQVSDPIILAGLYFSPGTANIWWDAVTVIGTATVNATGFFNTTITVPMTGVGNHWIVVQDSGGVLFYVQVEVTPTLLLNPSRGPVGTTVTATAFGFPIPSGTTVYNVTLTWSGYTDAIVAWSLTNASGQFTTTFVVPHDAGGAHDVTALANDTGGTFSVAQFTITPTLVVNPASFTNNGSVVNVYGTGFDPAVGFTPNIDNGYLGVDPLNYDYMTSIYANDTGDIRVQFVAAGFSYGTHVFSLYAGGETTLPAAQYALFNVLLTAGDPTVDMLTSINNTVTSLSGLSGVNATLLVGISNNVATLVTNVGLVRTDLANINATIVSIKGDVATIKTDVGIVKANVSTIMPQITGISNGVVSVQTAVGTVQTSLSSIGSTLSSVSGSVGTISTTLGHIDSSLSSIGTTVTSIKDGVATIQTDVGTIKGTVTSTDGKVATIQTGIGTLQADVSDVQTSVDAVPGAVNTPIYIAAVLALVAAIASIASLVLMRRKIAG